METFCKSDVRNFFKQNFTFEPEKDWNLPSDDVIFKDPLWVFPTLQESKTRLNRTKSLLDDKGEEWREHTARINKTKLVINYIRKEIRPELLTQAWCIFYEILSNYDLIPNEIDNFKSLHLCEAPGAFISALNCYLCNDDRRIHWKWYANTLNPYYEDLNIKNVISDDRLIFPTLKYWYFGEDNTGDIRNPNFPKNLQKYIGSEGAFHLVTADGSIDCTDNPSEQEIMVSELQFAEMIVALHNLSHGGSFVLKKFTFFESISICKMYFLNCIFKEIHVFKPCTSKSGNSEVFVICLGYDGIDKLGSYLEKLNQNYKSFKDNAMFPFESIPKSFMAQMVKCSNLFVDLQTKTINENLRLFSRPFSDYKAKLEEVQEMCAEEYLERCDIHQGLVIHRLESFKEQIVTSSHDKDHRNGKLLTFQVLHETFENLVVSKSMLSPDILNIERRLDVCVPKDEKRKLDNQEHDNIPKDKKRKLDAQEYGIMPKYEDRRLHDQEWYFIPKKVVEAMKGNVDRNWLLTGKKVHRIQNSKFCNPMLIDLWNKISYRDEINIQNHMPTSHYYWDIDLADLLLKGSKEVADKFCIISMYLKEKELDNDSTLIKLKRVFNKCYNCDFSTVQNDEVKLPQENRIIYINSICWVESLNQELKIKQDFTEVLCKAIKIMKDGNSLIICIQSLLTRYMAGIIFMLLSLFEKYQCLLPDDEAPAFCGQMWILKNFRKSPYTSRVIDYLESIIHFKAPEGMEILETVPVETLCGNEFYEYLLDLNNNNIQRRLSSLISVEKQKL
ncbi:cap-specific mRNA [Caerostris darwini]|uniref:Cap-specific mRNA (nucleoside-2'-O-)-methyltransferase 2 n=1 Tax=Caerostris darwini TaxID=1538125 RepID=A0AAV4SJ15_9ARAC|nr:cap-specific mRNA [Caerostris darwini]